MNSLFIFGAGYIKGLKYKIKEDLVDEYIVHIKYEELIECLQRNNVRNINELFRYWNKISHNSYEIINFSYPSENITVGVITNNREGFRIWYTLNQMLSIKRSVNQSSKVIRLGNTLYKNITSSQDLIGLRFNYFIEADTAFLNKDYDEIKSYVTICLTE